METAVYGEWDHSQLIVAHLLVENIKENNLLDSNENGVFIAVKIGGIMSVAKGDVSFCELRVVNKLEPSAFPPVRGCGRNTGLTSLVEKGNDNIVVMLLFTVLFSLVEFVISIIFRKKSENK